MSDAPGDDRPDPPPESIPHRLLRWVNFVIWCFGVAAIYSVAFVGYQAWQHGQPSPFQAQQPPSALAAKFSGQISPGLQSQLRDNKEPIITSADGWMTRAGLRMGFDALVNLIPRVLAAGFDVLMDIWGGMNMRDLASMLLEHGRQRGRDVHPTVHAAAQGTLR